MREEIDTSLVGHVAAELIERVGQQFGEDAELETVAVVAEVRHRDDDDADATTITCSSSDSRAWVQAGLLSFASKLVERQGMP